MAKAGLVKVPRFLGKRSEDRFELHGFCDASSKAFLAVVYVRLLQDDNAIVTLLASKTKFAPVKTLTIPRLELCTAVLLCKLVCHIRELDFLKECPIHLWSDSTVVLAWQNSSAHLWLSFVAHRIAEIQMIIGITLMSKLIQLLAGVFCVLDSSLWWYEPLFLSDNSQPFSVVQSHFDSSECPENCKVVHQVCRDTNDEWEIIS